MSEITSTHPEHLQHHFTDEEQQRESAKFGMWVFLLTEILLFGGLFVVFDASLISAEIGGSLYGEFGIRFASMQTFAECLFSAHLGFDDFRMEIKSEIHYKKDPSQVT